MMIKITMMTEIPSFQAHSITIKMVKALRMVMETQLAEKISRRIKKVNKLYRRSAERRMNLSFSAEF